MNQSSVKGNDRDEMVLPYKNSGLTFNNPGRRRRSRFARYLSHQAVGVAASLVPASAQALGAY